MAYSQKLIDAVKQAYPDYDRINELAQQGSVWLGRYLDDSSPRSISIDTILNATSLEQLKQLAQQYRQKLDVYTMWCEEDPRKQENNSSFYVFHYIYSKTIPMDNFDLRKFLTENKLTPNAKAISEEVHGQSALHKLAKSCESFQEFVQKAKDHLEKTSPSTLKPSGTVSPSMKRNLKSIWDERNDDDYDTVDEQQINEEDYDFVRDIENALGKNPDKGRVERYLGRRLTGDESSALGFGRMVGMKGGQPIYAGQKPSRDWRHQATGVRRRYEQ